MDIYGPDVLTPKPNTPGTGTDVITSASKDNSEFRSGLVDKMRESQAQMLENYVTMISAKNAGATDSKQKLYFQEAIKNTPDEFLSSMKESIEQFKGYVLKK